MSLFKRFGGKKPKSKSEGDSPNSPNGENAPFRREEGATGEESTPQGPANKKERNLSISRSGRYKYNARERRSVLGNDIYNDKGSPETSPQGPNSYTNRTPSSPWSETANCREKKRGSGDHSRLDTSSKMTSQPTPV